MPGKTPTHSPVDEIVAHHAEMVRALRDRTEDLIAVASFGDSTVPATSAVVDYLSATVFPHAAAEETTLYATASRFERRLVDGLILEHQALHRLGSELAAAREPGDRVAIAGAITEIFALHATKENDLILPTLMEHAPGDVTRLVQAMHEQFDHEQEPAASIEIDVRGLPHAARHEEIFGRLSGLSAREALVIINDHDPAPLRSQLNARWPGDFSWAYEESGPERWKVVMTRIGQTAGNGDGGDDRADPDLDVRDDPPATRHKRIFETYAQLSPGTAFVLVNDHDPKPLYYQFEAEHHGEFEWDVLESGPEVWRVRIGRPAVMSRSAVPALDVAKQPGHG